MNRIINQVITLLLILLTIKFGHTQIYFKDQLPYSDSAELQNLYHQSLLIQDSFYQSGTKTQLLEIFEVESGKYLVIDGRFNLFAWKKGIWVDISKSKYHGYNHMSKKFIFNNSIYSFGGYGFWREHGDLIKYDWDRNEWESVTLITNEDIGNNASFIHDHYLYVINPVSRNQHINQNNKHGGIYQIDLLTRKVDVLSIDSKLDLLKFGMRIETQNYYIPTRDPFHIIDKINMKFKLSDITYALNLSKQSYKSLILIRGDSLTIQNTDTAPNIIQLNFDFIYKNAPFPERSILKNYMSTLFGVIVVIFVLFGFIIYNKKVRSKKITPSFIHPILDKIIVHSGKVLKQEEFDSILEIDQLISIDNQKTKRANIFKDVNSEYCKYYGIDLIKRIPDPSDRRKYLYQIK